MSGSCVPLKTLENGDQGVCAQDSILIVAALRARDAARWSFKSPCSVDVCKGTQILRAAHKTDHVVDVLPYRIARSHMVDAISRTRSQLWLDMRTRERAAERMAFSYQTRSFIESGDVMDALVGNGPLFVTREGTIFETGTAEPSESYVENFKRYGTPFPTPQG